MKNLKTHIMELNARKDRELQKKNGAALKTSSRDYKKKSVATPTISEDEEELTLQVQNINMYLKKERRMTQDGKTRRNL